MRIFGATVNAPFVDLKKTAGTGIPFVDFDSNNKVGANIIGQNQLGNYQFGDNSAILAGITPTNRVSDSPSSTYTNFQSGARYGYGGSGTVADPAAIAEASDLIAQSQNLIDRLGNQRNIGNDNITNTFSTARNTLTGQKSRTERDYNDSKEATIKGNQTAKARIDTQVRNRSNALQRFLGAAGGGDSQAASVLAPYAAARTGTQLRQQVNEDYSGNMRGLDTSWNDFLQDFQASWGDLDAQEKNKRNELESSILNQELSARDNLRKGQSALEYAKTGNTAQARALREQSLPLLFQILQQIDNLQKQSFNPNVKTVAYEAPELESYDTEQLGAIGGGVDPSMGSDVSPAYQYLVQKQKEDQDFFGY